MSSTNSPAQEKRRRSFVGSFLVPLKTKRSDGPSAADEQGAKSVSKSPSSLEQLAGLPREGGHRPGGRSSRSGSVADSPPTKEKKTKIMKQRRSIDLLDTLMRDDEVHDVPSNKLQQPKGVHAKAMPKVTSAGGLGQMSRRTSSMSMAAKSTKAVPRRNSVFALEDPPSADDYLRSGNRGQGVDLDGAWGSRGLNPLEEEVRAELHKMAREQYQEQQQQREQEQEREQFNGSFNLSYQPARHSHSKSQSPRKQQQQQQAAEASFHKSESNLTFRKERRSSQSLHHEGNKGQKKQQPRQRKSKDPDGCLEDDVKAIHAEGRRQGRRNSQHSPHPIRGFEDPSETRHLKNKKGETSSRPSSHGFPTVKVRTDKVVASAATSSKNDKDPNYEDEDGSVSNVTVDPSVPDLDSYDAAKLQAATAEELRELVAMMQVEFHGLQCAKVAAEMRAETLETDLSASAEERDAEVMRLSEEKDKWTRVAHRERVSREGMEEKVANLEREKERMQKQWGKAMAAQGELEGRLKELEEENKRMRRKLKTKNQEHDGRDSVDDACSVSTAEPPTSKLQSSQKTDHSPSLSSPRSPSSQQRCPQSVHSRLSSHDDRHPSSSNSMMPQAPASWHVPGRHMSNIRDLSGIPPVPLEVGRHKSTSADPTVPPFAMGPPRKSTSVHHAGSRRPASILRRKSSYGTASTTHSSVRSSLRGSSLSVPEEDVEDHRRLSEFMKSLESGMALVDHAEDGKERVDDSTRSGPL